MLQALTIAVVASLAIIGTPWLPWVSTTNTHGGVQTKSSNGFGVTNEIGIDNIGFADCRWNSWFGWHCEAYDDDARTLIFTGYTALAFGLVGAATAALAVVMLRRERLRSVRRLTVVTMVISAASFAAAVLTAIFGLHRQGYPTIDARVGPFLWLGLAGLATVSAAMARAASRKRAARSLTATLVVTATLIALVLVAARPAIAYLASRT